MYCLAVVLLFLDNHPKVARTSSKRYRRADLTSQHTVELMLVIDYTLYKL